MPGNTPPDRQPHLSVPLPLPLSRRLLLSLRCLAGDDYFFFFGTRMFRSDGSEEERKKKKKEQKQYWRGEEERNCFPKVYQYAYVWACLFVLL